MARMTRLMQFILATALTCATASHAAAESAGSNSANARANVVELFTSQGCSSCPRADALFKQYANQPGIVALSFNVDYWDYLGWKDTLGSPANSQRQRAYALARGDGKVYTPQIVANGLSHAIGSDPNQVNRAIGRSSDRISRARVNIALESDSSNYVITIAAGPKPAKPATVYIAAVSPAVTIKIKRGENHGRKITYHNVVRSMLPVGMWSGEATTIRLRRQDILTAGAKRCAVLVQTANAGPILAAGWMPE
jgi:hypothetical protein